MEKKIEDIVADIKQIDNNVTNIVVPVLKDTIKDYEKIISKLVLTITILIFAITGVSVFAIYKYNEFLSQFEYETEVYQDSKTSDDSNLTVNSGVDYK